MSVTTKVYRLVVQDHMVRHYHFATKGAARKFLRKWVAENDPHDEWPAPAIYTVVVRLNATGIAKALDDFISITCANEG